MKEKQQGKTHHQRYFQHSGLQFSLLTISQNPKKLPEIYNIKFQVKAYVYIGGSRGRTRRPPKGTRFFRFAIQILQNVATSGVPPLRGARLPTGNPGCATGIC